MSKYTVTLRQLTDPLSDWKQKVENAFMEHTLPQDPQKAHLTRLFALFKAYYDDYEIGYETPAMFCRQLSNRMLYLVDKYGEVFIHSSRLTQDALANGYDTDSSVTLDEWKTDHLERTNDPDYNTHSSGTTNGGNENRAIEDDNPEKGIDIDGEFSSNTYATRLNHNISSNTGSSTGDTRLYGTTEDIVSDNENHHTYTKTESNSYKPLDELYKLNNYTNYDIRFIMDLEPLFMEVY